MEYRQLGNSGLKVSVLTMGTMTFGMKGGFSKVGDITEVKDAQRQIDMVIDATANASTIQPESGVFSLHYIFRDEAHAIKALGDPGVTAAMREMFASKVKGAHMLTLAT